ncbi:MAG TPA: hypothetical protein PK867_19140, partial [Pirellulales bacterium]|nr:hypothetical protein [Pirellulales bacterium]
MDARAIAVEAEAIVKRLRDEAKERQARGGGDRKSDVAKKSVHQKFDEPTTKPQVTEQLAELFDTNRQYVSDSSTGRVSSWKRGGGDRKSADARNRSPQKIGESDDSHAGETTEQLAELFDTNRQYVSDSSTGRVSSWNRARRGNYAVSSVWRTRAEILPLSKRIIVVSTFVCPVLLRQRSISNFHSLRLPRRIRCRAAAPTNKSGRGGCGCPPAAGISNVQSWYSSQPQKSRTPSPVGRSTIAATPLPADYSAATVK